ncbi:MAG: CBS domain-containing protein [Gammaproteobacteria bacterium]
MQEENNMGAAFKSLPVMLAPANTTLTHPSQSLPENVTKDSPAIDAMTDLSRMAAAVVEPELLFEKAEERMRNAGVRLLFVLGHTGEVLGLITLNDLKGMRAIRYQQKTGSTRSEVLVRDIMTPREKLEALTMADVVQARVGDIIETLKRTGRQHALVIERSPGRPAIRGIFSARQIGRQLGVPIDTSGIAWTFAELEAALGH